MAEPAPKCGRCDGWGFEPDRNPIANCKQCAGTGRPRAKQKELIDG